VDTDNTPPIPPIVCDMTDAPDTPIERIAEYERIFSAALIGRERTDGGIRFRFRCEDGLAEWIRDLAAREQACCAFFAFTVTQHGEEIWWDASVVDDDIARRILDEFYRLAETVTEGAQALHARFADQGLHVVIGDGGAFTQWEERARRRSQFRRNPGT
jgi:hypothetical protein